MKIRVLAIALMVLVAATSGFAQSNGGEKIKLDSWTLTYLPVSNEEFTIGGTYGWSADLSVAIKGNGFLEWYGGKAWITNHQLKASTKRTQYVWVLTEQGGSASGAYFQVAAELRPMEVAQLKRQLEKLLSDVNVSHYVRLAGEGPSNETQISWTTQELLFFRLNANGEGFCRVRKHDPVFCRAELWAHHKKLARLEYGIQYQRAGGDNKVSFGIKLLSK
jgi:hypothetical protein